MNDPIGSFLLVSIVTLLIMILIEAWKHRTPKRKFQPLESPPMFGSRTIGSQYRVDHELPAPDPELFRDN